MSNDDEDDRKITWRFRLWWFRHKRHLKMRHPYGGGLHCMKCKIMAPEPFKE